MKKYLEDAQYYFEELSRVVDAGSIFPKIRTALLPLEKVKSGARETINFLFASFKTGGSRNKKITVSTFLHIEDAALSLADYLLSDPEIKEFDRAVLLENIRQELLLPLLEKNEAIKAKLGMNEASLKRHTPIGF